MKNPLIKRVKMQENFKTKNSTLQLCYLLLSLINPTSYLWS